MKQKLFCILTLLLLLITQPLSAQERVEVLTPERVEATAEITFPIPYIPILRGMDYQPGKSALLKTGTILTGMLVFKSGYKPTSLVEFYRTQMRAQGWEELGSFTAKTTFLAFRRPDGQAFIGITEGWTSTEVRIIVFLSGVR
ncbi:MAG: hypothetical protein N2327_05830 [Caldimicrobium sp.]|nr:hypothetical protein [Caldimicrobium sp.]